MDNNLAVYNVEPDDSTVRHTLGDMRRSPELELEKTREMLRQVSQQLCVLLLMEHGGMYAIPKAAVDKLNQDYQCRLVGGFNPERQIHIIQAQLTPKLSVPQENKIILPDGTPA